MGRTNGGLRVEFTGTRGSTQVEWPTVAGQRWRGVGGWNAVYGEVAGIRLTTAGQTLCLRGGKRFGPELDWWPNDASPETHALFEALSAALQPVAANALANPHSVAHAERVH